MDSLLKKIDRQPLRSEPRVWISQITIFEQIEPNPIIIRRISLKKGFNIISAEENNDVSQSGLILGHSAGKTTLCRFIRYLLGENTFASEKTTSLIKSSLQKGWVGGELHILKRKWAVLRPLGGNYSYVKESTSIDLLIKDKGTKISNAQYWDTLGFHELLNDLAVKDIVPTGESITWGHVLSWCTRDQEARLSHLSEWRAQSSCSGSPAFIRPKEGPLFTMRALLDLLQTKEVESEKRLGEFENSLKLNKNILENKRHEPEIGAKIHESTLRNALSSLYKDIDTLPYRSDNLTDDTLSSFAQKRCSELLRNMNKIEAERQEVKDTLSFLSKSTWDIEKQIKPFEIQIEINRNTINELEGKEHKTQIELDELYGELNKLCCWGRVIIKNCTHYSGNIIPFNDLKDNKKHKEEIERYQKLIRDAEAEITPLKKRVEDMKSDITLQHEHDNKLGKSYVEMLLERDKLSRLLDDIDACKKEIENPTANGMLEYLSNQCKELDNKIKEEKAILQIIQKGFETNSTLLSSIFSALINRLLPGQKTAGRVVLENGKLAFNIIQGQELGGEAINTLSILLADLSCLVYNTVYEKSNLPDFLLHDSPREADMGGYLYSNYLRLAASLQDEYGSNCPFQYIVTTTTPPPEDLKKHVVLHLGTYPESELLLKRQLKLEQLNIDIF